MATSIDTMSAHLLLLYHSVSDRSDGDGDLWTVSVNDFKEQMTALLTGGFTPLSVSAFVELRRSGNLPARPVVITVDDGLADFYDGALPVLARLGIPATLFVVADDVGGVARWLSPGLGVARRMLTWAQLRVAAHAGIELASHGLTHAELDVLSIETARKEISESKALLEDRLDTPVTAFSYPHGYYDGRTRAAVRDAGYESACAVGHTLSKRDEDRFRLSRVMVHRGTPPDRFEGWLYGNGLKSSPNPDIVRAMWRGARRVRARVRKSAARTEPW